MKKEQANDQDELINLYRALHKIPQMGLQEFQTTEFIRNYVNKIEGAEILEPQLQTELKTGVIAVVKAEMGNQKGYLFRCDIDALNFKQESGVSYCSENGMHHACGHDAHTAIMLITLKHIAFKRGQLRRNIYFCFQPGQEGHGGASKLLQKYPTLLQQVENCFALHVGNFRLKGDLIIPSQYATANSNRIKLQITGKSAHCMMPHAAIDANYIGCQVVNQIYSLKTRMISPQTGMAIAVTRIEGGNEKAISISDTFTIIFTIRSYIYEEHKKVVDHIHNYTKLICELNGAKFSFEYVTKNYYRAVRNDKSAIQIVQRAAQNLFPKVQFGKPSFAGEDFCEFSQKKPSCYFILGVGLQGSIDQATKQSKFPIHSSRFKLDEASLMRGCDLWEKIALS